MKTMKRVTVLLVLIGGHMTNASDLNEWRNNLTHVYGQQPFERETINQAYYNLRAYQDENNYDSANLLYEQLRQEYNPRILDQTKRPLFNDLYAKLQDEKLQRSFTDDYGTLQNLLDQRDEEAAEKLYESLVEKYQHGSQKKSVERRLKLLQSAIKRIERARARRVASAALLPYDEAEEVDEDSSDDDGVELIVAEHFPVHLNPVLSSDEGDSDYP